MRRKIALYLSSSAVIVGICAVAIILVVYPAVLLKWIDVVVFAVFIGLSVLCIVRRIRGSVLILVCWCVIVAVSAFSRLYSFSPDGYVRFVSYALPAAETVCALLTGLWLIRLQRNREEAKDEHRA